LLKFDSDNHHGDILEHVKITNKLYIMEEIKRLLLEEKAALLSEIQEKTGNKNEINNDIGDAIDSSVEEQERELDLLLQDRELARLEGIEIALKRMASDDFGYCDECGEAISKKRLLAFPLARMCINCQSNEERSRLAQNAFSRADYSSQVLGDE
tara:strand:+ start:21 stop:485 length:465 start_codon:yes stop_codon:yes gene_type:complete